MPFFGISTEKRYESSRRGAVIQYFCIEKVHGITLQTNSITFIDSNSHREQIVPLTIQLCQKATILKHASYLNNVQEGLRKQLKKMRNDNVCYLGS